MNDSSRNKIDPSKFQVFLVGSRANLPFVFATHHWFVINNFGHLSRWEVLFRKDASRQLGYHLYKDKLQPFDGLGIIPYLNKPQWSSSVLHIFEGDQAQRLANLIESSPSQYPYKDQYSLKGPNSNSYAQWILNHCKDSGVGLPWTAIGKDYKFDN